MENEVTQEQLIEAVKNAKTKHDLRVAAYNLARHNDTGNRADHDRMVEIMGQLRDHVNATPAPAFSVPFSVRLIALMGQDLGPGWRIFVRRPRLVHCHRRFRHSCVPRSDRQILAVAGGSDRRVVRH